LNRIDQPIHLKDPTQKNGSFTVNTVGSFPTRTEVWLESICFCLIHASSVTTNKMGLWEKTWGERAK